MSQRIRCRLTCWLLAVGLLPLLLVSCCDSRRPRAERSLLDEQHERPSGSARGNAALDSYDELPEDSLEDDYVEINVTAEKSKYLGSPCDLICNPMLLHVYCNQDNFICECEKNYPVKLGPTKGCAKPKKLGEQCLYRATCVFSDQHSTCTQVQHNAVCECEAGFHRVPLSRANKKLFCAEDILVITTDLPTLLGVFAGIAVLTGLMCFGLKLYSRARYVRPRRYANAAHAPAMLYSSDTGIPLTMHGGRPASRSSQRSSGGTINSIAAARKHSDPTGGRGPLVPSSRAGAARAAAILLISCHRQATNGGGGGGSTANNHHGSSSTNGSSSKHRRALSDVAEASPDGLGSRRPSLASIHSTTSSAKSFSARRLERERNEKEARQLILAELKLKREQQQQQQQQQQQPQPAPSPSPRTPHSTDELLPAVEETTEIFYAEQKPTTSGSKNLTVGAAKIKTTLTRVQVDEAATPLFQSEAKPSTSADVYR